MIFFIFVVLVILELFFFEGKLESIKNVYFWVVEVFYMSMDSKNISVFFNSIFKEKFEN